MKRIITTLMLLVAFTTTSQADSNIDNTKDYINKVNSSMAQLDANTSIQEKATISSLLFNGIESGYINPSMNNEIKLRDSLNDLVSNIESYNIKNDELRENHKMLLSNVDELIILLNERIECKSKALSSDNRLIKLKYIIIDDSENVSKINNKIDSINKIYKSISKFDKKYNTKKYA